MNDWRRMTLNSCCSLNMYGPMDSHWYGRTRWDRQMQHAFSHSLFTHSQTDGHNLQYCHYFEDWVGANYEHVRFEETGVGRFTCRYILIDVKAPISVDLAKGERHTGSHRLHVQFVDVCSTRLHDVTTSACGWLSSSSSSPIVIIDIHNIVGRQLPSPFT